MQIDSVKKYLTSSVKTPYFLFVSDGQYTVAIDELSVLGLDFVQMSGFCEDDKLPDIDGLLTYIEAADVNANGKKFVVTGLGEYLALRGNDEASRTLSRLKDLNVGGAKVVLLLRGLASQIAGLQTDPRFDNRRFSVVDKAECDLSFTLAAPSVGLSALSGFKAMLAELENGRCGSVIVNTAVNLDKAIFTVHQINNAYEGIRYSTRCFALVRSCGNDARWAELLTELNQSNGSLDEVFEKHGLNNSLESDFYARIAGSDYRNWLYFICLKSKADILQNGYLRFVLDKTSRFEDFVGSVLNAIIEIQHTDKRFAIFYQERKALVEKFPESDIADFVVNSRQVLAESIYKLTDSTRAEREEIIAWLSKNGLVPQLESIYPVLAAYLKKYVFKCPELADLLTEYFESYKRQKLSNELEADYLKKVDELALSRKFNRLPTRNEIMDGGDKSDTFLYWLDALGVEYLGLIEALVQKRGLSVRVNIARAELPTITSINRDFFDAWQGRKEKNDELDDTKHSDAGGYNFTDNELPIHLAKELDIIAAMIDKAATELALRHCKRFLIVSDHGASRLAVLRRKEEKYDTDTTGEHSGRCCRLFQPYDLPFAAEENGHLVLADYGRFKGSRAANVEVHGGASLEEVVVPVIELSLKDGSVTTKLVDEVVTVDFRSGTEIKLFFNSTVQDVSVVLNGKPYSASQIDENHYSVKLPDTKRAGEYPADVYAGDNLIGKILIKVQGKSGKVNDAFDDLF
ncbi:hypothetical protein B1778_01135 [Dehalococcoides mccartyi]|uniref:BREX-4 system phosphatase PglZ n=1 Tax=Dehalococcoides mccartyi TaxID=61435 RepID=UPI00098F6D0C|nr:BREX-4 system phosphatase PglZ [Dehalococcoides mccartyi]AQU05371.1 hypothetical protein B1777_01280 [Dehalococcoides mccartyi]AQU06824.1 hypothetical protein B1778_01135 [Dehalococcoides mccartyi]